MNCGVCGKLAEDTARCSVVASNCCPLLPRLSVYCNLLQCWALKYKIYIKHMARIANAVECLTHIKTPMLLGLEKFDSLQDCNRLPSWCIEMAIRPNTSCLVTPYSENSITSPAGCWHHYPPHDWHIISNWLVITPRKCLSSPPHEGWGCQSWAQVWYTVVQ